MTHCATVPQVGIRANSLYSNFQHGSEFGAALDNVSHELFDLALLKSFTKRTKSDKSKDPGTDDEKKTTDTHDSRLDPHSSSRTCTKAETFLSCIAYIIKMQPSHNINVQPEDAPFPFGSQTSPHALWARNGGSEPRRQCPQLPPPIPVPTVHAPSASVPMAELSVVIRDTRERTDGCLL